MYGQIKNTNFYPNYDNKVIEFEMSFWLGSKGENRPTSKTEKKEDSVHMIRLILKTQMI